MMGLEPHSKIVVNCSPTTLIIIVNHSWLDLALSSFSMFVWIVHSIWVNAIWTYLDLFSSLSIILSFLILFTTFLSIAFCFKLQNIGLMWPHMNWNSLLVTLWWVLLVNNFGNDNRSTNGGGPLVWLRIFRLFNLGLRSCKFTSTWSCSQLSTKILKLCGIFI